MSAAPAVEPRTPAAQGQSRPTTLLELVTALSELTDDEAEVVAAVIYLLQSGQVKLCGNFRDHPIEDFID